MRNKTAKSFFIIVSSLNEIELAAHAGRATAAYTGGDLGGVWRNAAPLLCSNSPVYALVGEYFTGLVIMDGGRGDMKAARERLERAAESCRFPYRDRALLSLSAVCIYTGDYSTSVKIAEAMRKSADPYTRLEARRAIATVYGMEGQSERALEILESMYPEVAKASADLAHVKAHYANSRAVELGELGRLDEAIKWSEIATGDTLAGCHPEFHKTHLGLLRQRATKAQVSVADMEGAYRRQLHDAIDRISMKTMMKVWNFVRKTWEEHHGR
jgi:hypothetical protein